MPNPYSAYLVYGVVNDSLGNSVANAKLKVKTSVSTTYHTTNSDGIFLYDLASNGYVSGETVTVDVTGPYNNEFKAHTFVVSGSFLNENISLAVRTIVEGSTDYPIKAVLHSVGKKPITHDNPLAVEVIGQGDYVDLVNNPSTVWVITRGDGQPDSETITLANGDIYQRTFTYTNDLMTARTAWQKQ